MDVEQKLKTCNTCHKTKPLVEMVKNTNWSKDGYKPLCKECARVYNRNNYIKNRAERLRQQREWSANNNEYKRSWARNYYKNNKTRYKNSRYKSFYGLGYDSVLAMVSERLGKCDICGGTFALRESLNQKGKYLVVDHDHKTGKVRGILCCKCNFVLGNTYDSIAILQNAITYLRKHGDKHTIKDEAAG